MMRFLIASIAAASAALGTSPAAAQSQPQQPSQAAAPAAAPADPVICEKEEVTGSRLATRKVCMTRSQWEDARRQDRMNLEKTQTQRGMESSGKGG